VIEKLAAAHEAGKLKFFGSHAQLSNADAFAAFLSPRVGNRARKLSTRARVDRRPRRHSAG
jgi:hypothetical protein